MTPISKRLRALLWQYEIPVPFIPPLPGVPYVIQGDVMSVEEDPIEEHPILPMRKILKQGMPSRLPIYLDNPEDITLLEYSIPVMGKISKRNIPLRLPIYPDNSVVEILEYPAFAMQKIRLSMVDNPYNAGDYSASGTMSWTINPASLFYRYGLFERILFVSLFVDASTIAGMPDTTLYITLPHGLVAANTMQIPIFIKDNGVLLFASAFFTSGSPIVACTLVPSANWSLSVANTMIAIEAWMEIQ